MAKTAEGEEGFGYRWHGPAGSATEATTLPTLSTGSDTSLVLI